MEKSPSSRNPEKRSMSETARGALTYVVVPLWVLAGFADWWCHRRSSIELTSGLRESAFHIVLFAQMGIAVLAALFLEPTTAVLAALAVLFVLHELTTWIELRLVDPVRNVSPTEQMVHSFLELLPLTALLLLAASSAGQSGQRATSENRFFQLALAKPPLPYLAALALAIMALNVLPLIEEAIRCKRARKPALASVPQEPPLFKAGDQSEEA
jgi:hypothetical protein